MREATLYCGGVKQGREPRGEAYVLDANLPKGTPGSVTVDVDDLRTAMLEDMPARMENLLHIAAYVYCADQLVRRDTPTMHQRGSKWRRSFCFHVAVGDVEFWTSRAVRDQLERALSTLSEDTFEFVFSDSSRMPRPSPFFGLSAPGRNLDSSPIASFSSPAGWIPSPERWIALVGVSARSCCRTDLQISS